MVDYHLICFFFHEPESVTVSAAAGQYAHAQRSNPVCAGQAVSLHFRSGQPRRYDNTL